MYSKTTHRIKVTVRPTYIASSSSAEEGRYVWAYAVNIVNSSKHTIQLISRHWQVIDAEGFMQEIRGKGVIGQQPVLAPKEVFEYQSQVHINSPSGIMLGTYHVMVQETGEMLDIAIPPFSLDIPNSTIVLH